MAIDFAATGAGYALSRVAYCQELFARLERGGWIKPALRVLDVAGGTGLFGEELARRGCRVTLCDHSAALLHHSDRSLPRVVAAAELLPFENASVDLISVANAWHWLERSASPAEILRVLKPAGVVVVVYQTHIPTPASVAEMTEQVILRHKPGWRHASSTGLNGQVLRDLQKAGFESIESFSFDVKIVFSRSAWIDFACTLSPTGPSMTPTQLRQFRADLQSCLAQQPKALDILHRVFAVTARKRVSPL